MGRHPVGCIDRGSLTVLTQALLQSLISQKINTSTLTGIKQNIEKFFPVGVKLMIDLSKDCSSFHLTHSGKRGKFLQVKDLCYRMSDGSVAKF